VVAHARQVLDAAAADHDDGVFLEVVAFARDVADHLEAVRQAHLRDLAQRRVRLLRRGGVHAGAHATLLRAALEGGHLVARGLRVTSLGDQLVDRRHPTSLIGPPLGGSISACRPIRRAGETKCPQEAMIGPSAGL